MECPDGDTRRSLYAQQVDQPLPHLFRGSVRKGYRQNRWRRDCHPLDQIGNAHGQCAGLAGARPGHNRQRRTGVSGRGLLRRIELIEPCGLLFADCILAHLRIGGQELLRPSFEGQTGLLCPFHFDVLYRLFRPFFRQFLPAFPGFLPLHCCCVFHLFRCGWLAREHPDLER